MRVCARAIPTIYIYSYTYYVPPCIYRKLNVYNKTK